LVQPELHPEDERRKGDGDSSQPHADAAAARVPEAVAPEAAEAFVPLEAAREADPFAYPESGAQTDPALPTDVGHPSEAGERDIRFDAPPHPEAEGSPIVLESGYGAEPPPSPAAPQPAAGANLRMTSPGFRLAQVKEELVAWFKTLVSAAVYAVLIVTFGFQVARVEGQSMAPTLEDQDRLIVNKLVYRVSAPRRGDIVMLYYPVDPQKSFVKRVIGEEGDQVRIVEGRVYVNDIPLHDDYVPSEYRSHDDWGPQVIPPGYYFVMGDHRNNSSDSRHWGMVPKKYIIGKVQLRWWPVPAARVF
jgi:signal peptidase I